MIGNKNIESIKLIEIMDYNLFQLLNLIFQSLVLTFICEILLDEVVMEAVVEILIRITTCNRAQNHL